MRDGPGIRTTVFFKGCPLNCWWCHNPESQKHGFEIMIRKERCIDCRECIDICPANAIEDQKRCRGCGLCSDVCPSEARMTAGKEYTVEDVLAEIEKDAVFYDQSGGGVTFSGGEPLMQPEFLYQLLKQCKHRGIHTAVDTSGYASGDTLKMISEKTDLFLYDIKLVDEQKHLKYTGVSNGQVLDNLKQLANSRFKIIVRIPIIPGINNQEKDARDIADFLEGVPHIAGVQILPYHVTGSEKYKRLGKHYHLGDINPPLDQEMVVIAQIISKAGHHVKIG